MSGKTAQFMEKQYEMKQKSKYCLEWLPEDSVE